MWGGGGGGGGMLVINESIKIFSVFIKIIVISLALAAGLVIIKGEAPDLLTHNTAAFEHATVITATLCSDHKSDRDLPRERPGQTGRTADPW